MARMTKVKVIEKMKVKTVRFTPAMLKGLEKAVIMGYAADMNRAIRDAVRDYLKELGLWRYDRLG